MSRLPLARYLTDCVFGTWNSQALKPDPFCFLHGLKRARRPIGIGGVPSVACQEGKYVYPESEIVKSQNIHPVSPNSLQKLSLLNRIFFTNPIIDIRKIPLIEMKLHLLKKRFS